MGLTVSAANHSSHKKRILQAGVIIKQSKRSPVARLDARPSGIQPVAVSILGSGNILPWRLVMKSFP